MEKLLCSIFLTDSVRREFLDNLNDNSKPVVDPDPRHATEGPARILLPMPPELIVGLALTIAALNLPIDLWKCAGSLHNSTFTRRCRLF